MNMHDPQDEMKKRFLYLLNVFVENILIMSEVKVESGYLFQMIVVLHEIQSSVVNRTIRVV